MRVIEGTDPSVIANQVAFIEKTPRVRVRPWISKDTDWENWEPGPKGGLKYGRDPDSRAWCNKKLVELGYALSDLKREDVIPTPFDPDLEYVDMVVSETLSRNNLNLNNYRETSPEVCMTCKFMYQASVEDVCQCTLAALSRKWNIPHVYELGRCDKYERKTR